jgi:adenylate cyclase
MPFEIERKFLVRGCEWQTLTLRSVHIRQAYLAAGGNASIRVRIKDNQEARLTIKSRGATLRRLELEYPIPVLEAEALVALRQNSVIQKVRHIVPWGGCQWEVDVFEGDNAGLVLAEIELADEQQVISLPPWIGPEVTGDDKYYNSALAVRPFSTWASEQQVAV